MKIEAVPHPNIMFGLTDIGKDPAVLGCGIEATGKSVLKANATIGKMVIGIKIRRAIIGFPATGIDS